MYNKAIVIGRIATELELKETPDGVKVCSFRLAVNSRKKGETDFLNVVTWRGTAEFVTQYFEKGAPIGIEGHIQARSYEDKSGNKRDVVEIIAEQVFFVAASKKTKENTEEYTEIEETEGLPF